MGVFYFSFKRDLKIFFSLYLSWRLYNSDSVHLGYRGGKSGISGRASIMLFQDKKLLSMHHEPETFSCPLT